MNNNELQELLKNVQDQLLTNKRILNNEYPFDFINQNYNHILIKYLETGNKDFSIYEAFEQCRYLISHYRYDEYYGNNLEKYDDEFVNFLNQFGNYISKEDLSDMTNLEKMELLEKYLSENPTIQQIEMIKNHMKMH